MSETSKERINRLIRQESKERGIPTEANCVIQAQRAAFLRQYGRGPDKFTKEEVKFIKGQ